MRHELRDVREDRRDEVVRRASDLVANDPDFDYYIDAMDFVMRIGDKSDEWTAVHVIADCALCGAILLSDPGGDFSGWVGIRDGGDYYNCGG